MQISSRFLKLSGIAGMIGFVDTESKSSILRYTNETTGNNCMVCYAHQGEFYDPEFGHVRAPFFLYNLGEDGGQRKEDAWHYMTGEMVIKMVHDLTHEIVVQAEFLGTLSWSSPIHYKE